MVLMYLVYSTIKVITIKNTRYGEYNVMVKKGSSNKFFDNGHVSTLTASQHHTGLGIKGECGAVQRGSAGADGGVDLRKRDICH